MTPAPTKTKSPERIYSHYRIGLACLLLLLFTTQGDEGIVGEVHPVYFFYYLLTYLATLLLFLRLPSPLRSPKAQYKALSLTFDAVTLLLLIYFSGSVTHSLTALLFVTVAAASIILPGRHALFIAALSALGLMFNEFYSAFSSATPTLMIPTKAALIGLALFAVAIAMRTLVVQLEKSEQLTAQQDRAISRLQKLNENIVARMLTGTIVFNQSLEIQLANNAARQLMQETLPVGSKTPRAIANSYVEWLANSSQHPKPIPAVGSRAELEVKFTAFEPNTIVAFIEDRVQILQQAQALKLASLGHLSASIAHEVRNPLSAISYAAELLSESSENESQRPLLNIIERHTQRINRIVSDVISISQGKQPSMASIDLGGFVNAAMHQWAEENKAVERISLTAATAPLYVYFDPSQLAQVLSNLTDNALRYSTGEVRITLGYTLQNAPCLTVSDDGPGIPAAQQHRLFEPFFTLAKDGTGLGLFLSREICQANQAHLHYQDTGAGASFVITFSIPTDKAIYYEYS